MTVKKAKKQLKQLAGKISKTKDFDKLNLINLQSSLLRDFINFSTDLKG